MIGKDAEALPFEKERAAAIVVDGKYVGEVGEFKNSVRHEFKLADYVAGFEIDLDAVLEYAGRTREIDFREKKKEDVTVTTDKSYAETLEQVRAEHPEAKITPGVIYQAPGQKTKNMTFHLEY